MSHQRPLRTHQRAVANLVAAIATGQATAVTDILAAVTPGGGKSLLPVIAAARLIEAGKVERICWVVPRDSLRLQAEEAFADPTWRAALNHDLAVRAAENERDPSRGLRSEEHTSELQSRQYLVCRLLLEKKKTDAIMF